jgi:hypothetical protein
MKSPRTVVHPAQMSIGDSMWPLKTSPARAGRTKKIHMKLLNVAMVAVLALAACTTTKKNQGIETKPAMNERTLENTFWVLTELNGKPVAAAKEGAKPNYILFQLGKEKGECIRRMQCNGRRLYTGRRQ